MKNASLKTKRKTEDQRFLNAIQAGDDATAEKISSAWTAAKMLKMAAQLRELVLGWEIEVFVKSVKPHRYAKN